MIANAWSKVAGVYEWAAEELVAGYPRVALGVMLALAVAAAV